MDYNTSRNYLEMREYGRHIQKMVEYLLTIEDREKRNIQAKSVIELMGFLNPHLRNVEDFRHMLWDHLFVISNFNLDVDSPYPIPQKDTYKPKGETMKYPRRYPKYAHLGKNLELVIDKALKEENPEKKVGFANAIAYYMKLSYSNWHKELVHDDTIRAELDDIPADNWNLVTHRLLNIAIKILKEMNIQEVVQDARILVLEITTDRVVVVDNKETTETDPAVVAADNKGTTEIATIEILKKGINW